MMGVLHQPFSIFGPDMVGREVPKRNRSPLNEPDSVRLGRVGQNVDAVEQEEFPFITKGASGGQSNLREFRTGIDRS